MARDTPIWLAWQQEEDGSFLVLETREEDGGYTRERREYGSLDEATEAYGADFRKLVEEVLASGSRRGRYRP
jgi:hypothetical protein